MNHKFSYYFDGARQTRTDIEFLQKLTTNSENQQDVIDGILESERRYIENKEQQS